MFLSLFKIVISDPLMITLNKILYISIATVLVFAVTGIGLWWFLRGPVELASSLLPRDLTKAALPSEHLIPKVPYRGQYLGTILSNQESTGVWTLLDYWGVPGVSTESLMADFEPSDADGLRNLTIYKVRDYFAARGFTAEVLPIDTPEQLKFLIANNIPVYVQQRLSGDTDMRLVSSRIYIGYSDETDSFIVHDNNFGNNFVISYEEYLRLGWPWQRMLVILPSDYALSTEPKLPSAAVSDYPARLPIMDDLGLRDIQIKLMLVNWLKRQALVHNENHVSEAVTLLENIINHPAFERLHPASRMIISYNLSGFYMSEVPNLARASEILETITLPLIEQYDFSQPFGGWDRKMDPTVYKSPFWNATPWSRLGFIYQRMGDMEKARAAFEKALEYVPNYPEAVQGLGTLGITQTDAAAR